MDNAVLKTTQLLKKQNITKKNKNKQTNKQKPQVTSVGKAYGKENW